MAITTLDAVIAGMRPGVQIAKAVTPTLVAGRPASLWSLGGTPGAGSFNGTLAGVALDSSSSLVSGQIPRYNPGSGNAYLARLQAAATQGGTLMLLDRLWHNGGFTITLNTAQTVNSAAFPARDDNGLTDGTGILLALEMSVAGGAASPTITISYTNQAGTAGRTATNINPTQNSPAIGATYLIGLQAGDTGVRSVQTLTLSASWLSGTMNLVAYRQLASLEVPNGLTSNAIDAVTGGLPRLYNGTVPWLVFVPNTTTATIVTGQYIETHG